MEVFIIVASLMVVVVSAIALFGYFILKSLAYGMDAKFPLDFVLQLQEPIKVLEDMGWQVTSYSGLGGDKPSVHLTKDGKEAILVLEAPVGAETSKITLSMRGSSAELDDIFSNMGIEIKNE